MFFEITFGSEVGFRADDRSHLIEYVFHLSYQRELGAGTVEVVVRAGNMEIMVALQIVGQETDASVMSFAPQARLFFSAVCMVEPAVER